MSGPLALYGFVRREDGLKTSPKGVQSGDIFLYHHGAETAAVVSAIPGRRCSPNPQDLVRHEEAVRAIFESQVILPAKYPHFLTAEALQKSLEEMDGNLRRVLRRVGSKSEYQVRVVMTEPEVEETPASRWNHFSRYILDRSRQFKYKHYFPLITEEAREAEFVEFADSVVKHITENLCCKASFWRGKSFQSEKVLLESFFWMKRTAEKEFEGHLEFLKSFYPNLRFGVVGPNPPYNFAQFEFAAKIK